MWSAINARTAVEGFYIAVRGDLEHYHEAKIFLTPKAKSFIKDILHFEPKHLALKFESWVVGDFASKRVLMNYDNYEKKIVEVYAVAIDGWTYQKDIGNPGKVGHRECLVTLLDALVANKCRWVLLTDKELSECISNNRERQANGEQVYKPCKAKQRHNINSGKSAEMVCDTDTEVEGQENEQDNQQDNERDNQQDNQQDNAVTAKLAAGSMSESLGSA
ncbi:hypothetical protein DFJ58DRAFT_847293 [Suillus subalutaceus]|uniref:uncharacterized protein n=1 Tax=Suillus subalutaceus TaxID=48586 RepID=UPI001B880B68|nr:uncharacterized protein DFJ58DRAFT_847293 [Suillus subalutaceus]KAG1835879.1 hypothetical protein DFJ58DRAFT_847293 [Suillus subalutaceus]